MLSQKIKKIYYFYNNWQKKFEEEITSDIEYRQGLPTEQDFKSYPNDDQCILVIDFFFFFCFYTHYLLVERERERSRKSIYICL